MTFAINFSWRDGTGIAGSDALAWADLGVQVGAHELDAMDVRLRTVRTHFVTSLLPLAEWLVEAWPRLTEERAAASPSNPHSWFASHSLRAGRGGGPMPDVRIRRLDQDRFLVRSLEDPRRAPGVSLSFLSHVEDVVPAAELLRELSRIVDAVSEQLKTSDAFAFRQLQERWSLARQPMSLLAGRLGLALDRIEDLNSSEAAALGELAAKRELVTLAEATQGTSLAERVRAARLLFSLLPRPSDIAPESAAWRAASIQRVDGRPWISGWRAAEQFRSGVGMDALEPPGNALRALLEHRLEWPEDQQLRVTQDRLQSVDMVTFHPAGRMPIAVTSARDPRGQRFRVAKCIYYALCSPEAIAPDSPLMPRHSEANAFAAELLAPKAFIEHNVPQGGVWIADAVEDLADHCGVDPRVIEHQIRNRDIGMLETSSS